MQLRGPIGVYTSLLKLNQLNRSLLSSSVASHLCPDIHCCGRTMVLFYFIFYLMSTDFCDLYPTGNKKLTSIKLMVLYGIGSGL